MEFLLFLCAALTALTGAITDTGARGSHVQIERVSAAALATAPRAARPVAAIVQAQAVPVLAALLAVPRNPAFSLAALSPLFGDRLRE